MDLSDPRTNALGEVFQEWEHYAAAAVRSVGATAMDFIYVKDRLTPGGRDVEDVLRWDRITQAYKAASRAARAVLFDAATIQPVRDVPEQVAAGADLAELIAQYNLTRALDGLHPVKLGLDYDPRVDALRGNGDPGAVQAFLDSLPVSKGL